MSVLSSDKDQQKLTLTFVAEFDASPQRVWQVWQDPRQLERWWGPPSWPATFERHDLVVGGQSRYHMTGPEGQKAPGWWTITAVDAPHRLEFEDGFSGDDGEPLPDGDTMHLVVTIEPVGERTRMTIVTDFTSPDSMQRLLDMGMEEGMRQALGQLDAVLGDGVR